MAKWLSAVLLLALALALPPAAGSTGGRVEAGRGLSVVLPPGWRLSAAKATICGSPWQVLLAVRGRVRPRPAVRIPPRAALVLLLEGSSGRFPTRPAHFRLPRLGNLGGCCEIPRGDGAELLFRDHGRRFYAFVYVGDRLGAGARRQVERLLDSVRVSAWR